MHIPRVGQEVIVNFLDGDPDRPIITGRGWHRQLVAGVAKQQEVISLNPPGL